MGTMATYPGDRRAIGSISRTEVDGGVVCSNCGTENKPGRKFCVECGAPLAVACPACGAANEPTAKYCGECGTAVAAASARAAAVRPAASAMPAPVAERRLVSVLFADIVGFTPFAEERDSEEVRETLTRYFDLATEVVGRYGGTIEKFIGDAVMAVWGAPTAREDDAERAVRAALDLLDAVRGVGPGISARAGVLTGEATVTIGATNQGMVAGDLVNTAARLQSVAPPGTVLVGEATQRAASSAIAFESAGAQALKGKVAPVAAWRALRVVAERGGRGRSDALEPPFVGRDDELRVIKDLFHATVREGRTRLVSITGIGGIGKSRLAWEFEKYLDGIVGTVWWHRGRSPAYGEGITFWALAEMIRGRAGLAENDDEATTRAKIGALCETVGIDAPDRRWIEPALLALLGVETGIGAEQLFGAWRTLFERLAATAPVVLVFEDLHWADSGTLDFIDHLLEWSRSIPLYIVTLARPELLDRRPDWGAGRRNFTSLYLEPLSAAAMRELLAGLVPGLPDAAVRAIVARAEGIPMYAVETIRMLVAEGRLTASGDGTLMPADDLSRLAVPETLTALIAARLDGLDPGDRSLILDAAVLGQSFTPAALAAVSGIEEPALDGRLRALVRRELFAHETDPRSPERGQYAFVQALIREVAYNTLARRDRKTRHLAAARYFETLGTDEIAAALAGQYLAARDNAADGPEADALGAQARIALRGAGERAAALGAHDQALGFYRQALTVAAPADQTELLERAGNSAAAAAHYEDAEAFLAQALALQRAAADRAATARVTLALAWMLLTSRQNDRALAMLVSATSEFADLAPDPVVVGLEAQLARAYMLREDTTRAVQTIDRVLEVAEHADMVSILADALVTKGTALDGGGRSQEGSAVLAAGHRLARANGLAWTELRALNNRVSSLWLTDLAASVRESREGLALARRLGDRSYEFLFLGKLGWTLWLTGEWDDALRAVHEGLEEAPEPADRLELLQLAVRVNAARGAPVTEAVEELERIGHHVTDPQVAWAPVDAAGFALMAEGRLAEAGECFRGAAQRYRLRAQEWLYLAAGTALRRGDRPAAVADLADLDALGLQVPLVKARRALVRAGLAALAGQAPEALALYGAAVEGFRDLGSTFDECLAAIIIASVLDPDDPDVRAAAMRGRELLDRLQARPFVEALDAALNRRIVDPSRTDSSPISDLH